jgi:UDP-GlcNAc:undecaprenyl-phosphate GlcNAc-1-phosphate transferase
LLIPTILSGVIAVLVATALTPLVRAGALRIGAVDTPGERKINKSTIPRMGGIAIAVAYTIALGIVLNTSWLDIPNDGESAFLGFIAGALIIFLAGIYDDLRQLGAKRKLATQVLAATAAWWGGARVYEVVNLPGLGAIDTGPVFAYCPVFAATAAYGHFGRPEFSWDQLDKVDEIKHAAGG